jgi:hypothetical protein
MDGYSVQEAASVLGVAEGRVWELLARGVLLGTPEGDSMRVFLKAEPGPIATSARGEPPRTNGNGGSHDVGEASAFRELLTEFRNLTERYGQALLALGEARGEVAGLRSRVDLLEARLDLRLPPPLEAAPVAWESATIPASTPESAPPPSPAKPHRAPVRRAHPKRKAPSARETVAGFADALARAQDPNAAELGDVLEPEEPLTATAEPAMVEPAAAEPAAEVVEQEMAVPAEPEAEPEPPQPLEMEAVALDLEVADEPPSADATGEAEPPTYTAVVVEPDWFADGDFAWLDAADREAAGAAEPPPAAEPPADEPPMAPAEASAAVELPPLPDVTVFEEPIVAELEPEPEPASEPALDAAEPAAEQLPEAASVPGFEADSQAEAEAEPEFERWQPEPGASAAPEPAVADSRAHGVGFAEPVSEAPEPDAPEPQTMSASVAVRDLEEEVMWLGAEPEPMPPLQPLPQQRAEAAPWPAVDAMPPTEGVRPPLAMTEDELARLAQDEGWDEKEVAAIRAMITPIPAGPVDLPGAAELHEAMAALEAVPVRSDPAYDTRRQWAKPAPEDQQPIRQDDWAFEAEPAPPPAPAPRPPVDVTSTLRRSVTDPNWLRRRQGPAAAAYRRLRRLFPG